jgi:hypothetical protein
MLSLSISVFIVAPCGEARRLIAVRNLMEFAKGLVMVQLRKIKFWEFEVRKRGIFEK